MTNQVKLTNVCPVFVSEDVKRTAEYYVNILGFKFASHFDKANQFAALYRDSIEIAVVQKKRGTVKSNQKQYGNGFDAYVDPDTLEGVDLIFREFQEKQVKIIAEPRITEYGSYEFVFEDIDGRVIGAGLIANKDRFFANSNYLDKNEANQ